MHKYFIAVYTNACKDYCDTRFFERLGQIQGNNHVYIVDNTDPEKHTYTPVLGAICDEFLHGHILTPLYVPADDHQFHHNVQQSVSFLREMFLASDCDHFLIIESDVIPPVDLLEHLDQSIAKLPQDWGILGCLYYDGFHNFDYSGIHPVYHALSGCTVYRREVIEQYPFRISEENWGAFPDAWICHDVNQDGKFKIFNDHDIRCEHLHHEGYSRQSKPI